MTRVAGNHVIGRFRPNSPRRQVLARTPPCATPRTSGSCPPDRPRDAAGFGRQAAVFEYPAASTACEILLASTAVKIKTVFDGRSIVTDARLSTLWTAFVTVPAQCPHVMSGTFNFSMSVSFIWFGTSPGAEHRVSSRRKVKPKNDHGFVTAVIRLM
jgi:hypothetical protein